MRVFFALATLLLVSCGTPESLRVRQFHLRDTRVATGHPFIWAETSKRLYGAVTEKERALRRGNYYHIRWHGLSGKKPVKVVFEYRLARTGAAVKKREFVAAASKKGDREIIIGGAEYLKSGHVQSWRATLYDGETKVLVKKSYLWE